MNTAPILMRIGLDFDNTIICYDRVFRDAAVARGLLRSDFTGNKQDIRDAIRLLLDGDISWQRLQGHVYGKGIGGAEPFDGLKSFLGTAKTRGDEVFIVSHKTEFGHFDPDRINLREAAWSWMDDQGFFSIAGPAIKRDNIFFAATRDEKLARIAELGCDVFVDDLVEVLDDPQFPGATRRILFSQQHRGELNLPYRVCANWREVEEVVLNGCSR